MPRFPSRLLALCAVGAALAAGCGDPSGLASVDADGDRIPLVLVDQVALADPAAVPATIEAATVSADTLRLRLSFAGGCGSHQFGLSALRAVAETEPPQVTVLLVPESNDLCRGGIVREVIADLRPLRSIAGTSRTLRLMLYEPGSTAPIAGTTDYSF
jgi:hypothetical protein